MSSRAQNFLARSTYEIEYTDEEKEDTMGIYVNTNVGGLRGRNYLNNINNQLDTTYQRLSSGLRISSAKDDAAGLAISDRMTSQINGLQQGNRNAADAIALMQTMEGGIEEIGNSLQDIRTLMIQANNGTNTTDDKKAIGAQMKALVDGIEDIAKNTKFGGKTILNGVTGSGTTVVPDGTSIFSSGSVALESGTNAIDGTVTFQIGANGGDTMSLTVKNYGTTAAVKSGSTTNAGILGGLGIETAGSNMGYFIKQYSEGHDLAAAADFATTLKSLDDMIQAVDKDRANIGANMNRLESTMRNQSNVVANQSDARSRIRDTDFAEESAKLSQQSILQQAAMSMLMQANARPQLALNLLG